MLGLIGKLVKHKLPDTSVHQWLRNQYSGCFVWMKVKEEPLESFYGGVSDEDRRDSTFFDKADKFIRKDARRKSFENGHITTLKG